MYEITGKYTKALITIDSLEDECIKQVTSFINHPAFTNPVAILPDAHAGKGSCVGFTMPMSDKIIPSVIGVDIGCGVLGFNIGSKLEMPLSELDHKIRQRVPFGFTIHDKSIMDMKKEFPWRKINSEAQKFALAYGEKFGVSIEIPQYDIDWFEIKCRVIGCDLGRGIKSLGSLGGGNHYIEVGISPNTGDHWITVHTGSRNFGKCVCEYWQNYAVKKVKKHDKDESKQVLKDLKAQYTGEELYRRIKAFKAAQEEPANTVFGCPDELRWLEGEDALGYLYDMIFAQVYAEENRRLIMETILGILKTDPIDKIETVHNFIDFRDFIIRKGSIRSYEKERYVLPLNMRDGVLICTGKSNSDFNFSAPHGAGRILSRSKAKKLIDIEVFKEQMKDIYSTSVCAGTLDEAPDAYKDSRLIEEAIEPTATIIDRIKPVMNMKAFESEKEKD